MFFAWAFCLLLASDSAIQPISVESTDVSASSNVTSKRFPHQTCFSSDPVEHFICPIDTDVVSPILLIFSYNCKAKRQVVRWFKSFALDTPVIVAEQLSDGPLTVVNKAYGPSEVTSVEGCSTCLRLARPVDRERDVGSYFARAVVKNAEVTSDSIKIQSYGRKKCPYVEHKPLTLTVNSQPLTSDTLVTVDDTVELEFVLPAASPPVTAAVYVSQQDLTYVRHRLRHTCDLTTGRCDAKVKMGDRVVPKVFYRDEASTTISILLLFRYEKMTPIQIRRDFTLRNPDFKEGHS